MYSIILRFITTNFETIVRTLEASIKMDVLLVLHHPWSMRNEKTGAQHFDVSLLLTESNITFSERIRPICLPRF